MDAVPQLTNCFFQQFVENKAAPDEAPVLQVLEARPMQGQANQILARFSDGIFSYGGCTITPVIIGRFRADGIGSHNAIIQVTNWKRAQLTGKVLFNVLDYKFLLLDFPIIGNPQAHSGNPNDYRQHMQLQAYFQQQMISTKQESENGGSLNATTGTPNANKRRRGSSPTDDSRQPQSKRQPQHTGARGASVSGLVPIEIITPYYNKWRICGIVSAKDTQIKEITNAKGTFRVFGFVITDQAGNSIRVSAFGDVADKVFQQIQNGQVYYISGSSRTELVRAANQNLNNTGHDYELTLDRDSEVTNCEENFTAPKLKLKPVLLSLIPQRVNECVDVQAIVERMGDITQVTSRKDQRQLDKRDVFLVDKSGTEICFTLWGDQAHDFNICPGNVIGIKGALVREFNGDYSISTGSGAQIIDNPENECTQQLYLWYRDQKPQQEIKTLSSTTDFERDFHLIDLVLQYAIDQALSPDSIEQEKSAELNVSSGSEGSTVSKKSIETISSKHSDCADQEIDGPILFNAFLYKLFEEQPQPGVVVREGFQPDTMTVLNESISIKGITEEIRQLTVLEAVKALVGDNCFRQYIFDNCFRQFTKPPLYFKFSATYTYGNNTDRKDEDHYHHVVRYKEVGMRLRKFRRRSKRTRKIEELKSKMHKKLTKKTANLFYLYPITEEGSH